MGGKWGGNGGEVGTEMGGGKWGGNGGGNGGGSTDGSSGQPPLSRKSPESRRAVLSGGAGGAGIALWGRTGGDVWEGEESWGAHFW